MISDNDNLNLANRVLHLMIEGHQGKSLDEAAGGWIDLEWNPPSQLRALAVEGLKSAVRNEYRNMVANRAWQLKEGV